MLNTYSSTVTSKGQATIPNRIREKFGIKPGDRIIFKDINGQLVIKTHIELVNELAGSLKSNVKWDKKKAYDAVGKMLAQRYIKTLPKHSRPKLNETA